MHEEQIQYTQENNISIANESKKEETNTGRTNSISQTVEKKDIQPTETDTQEHIAAYEKGQQYMTQLHKKESSYREKEQKEATVLLQNIENNMYEDAGTYHKKNNRRIMYILAIAGISIIVRKTFPYRKHFVQ